MGAVQNFASSRSFNGDGVGFPGFTRKNELPQEERVIAPKAGWGYAVPLIFPILSVYPILLSIYYEKHRPPIVHSSFLPLLDFPKTSHRIWIVLGFLGNMGA
jgi:hypothetical protein